MAITTKVFRDNLVECNGTKFFPSEHRGLSTDTKPSGNNGDTFYEIDTHKWYMHNGTSWVEQFAMGDAE